MPGFELIDHEERQAVDEVFTAGAVLFSVGFQAMRNGVYRVREFEQAFARRFQVRYAQAVSSGSAAVKVALKALGVGPGDEVITQSFTFVATVEAILECGATPVITEVNETLNMDPADLAGRVTNRTKAIVAVHMMGAPAQMEEILQVAQRHGAPVVEDACQACGGLYRGRPLGTLGRVGAFSFDFGKTLTTGEGGMVVTNDAAVYDFVRAYIDHGHENNPDRPRGKDTRTIPGFNYRMTELQGAIGLVQLRKVDGALQRQRDNKRTLKDLLSAVPALQFRTLADPAGDTGDTFVMLFPSAEAASAVAARLTEKKIGSKILPEALTWHFAGTWEHIFGDGAAERWPRSVRILQRAIALPILVKMDPDRIQRIADAVLEEVMAVL